MASGDAANIRNSTFESMNLNGDLHAKELAFFHCDLILSSSSPLLSRSYSSAKRPAVWSIESFLLVSIAKTDLWAFRTCRPCLNASRIHSLSLLKPRSAVSDLSSLFRAPSIVVQTFTVRNGSTNESCQLATNKPFAE